MDNEPLDILVINSHADEIGKMLKRLFMSKGYEPNLKAYDDSEKGADVALKSTGEQIIFCAVGSDPEWLMCSPYGMIQILKKNPDSKVIMFTGSMIYLRKNAYEDGADGYLTKPVDGHELARVVELVRDGRFCD